MKRSCATCGAVTTAHLCRRCEAGRLRARSEARGGWAWLRLKLAIVDRDEHRCLMCGALCPHPGHHDVDHIVPLARGGTNDPANLRTLCRACHRQHGAKR